MVYTRSHRSVVAALSAGLALSWTAAAAQPAAPPAEPAVPPGCEVQREANPATGELPIVMCVPIRVGVTGGSAAPVGLFPWQAEIYSTYEYTDKDVADDNALAPTDAKKAFLALKPGWERVHRCGGVYIGKGWVLTAAHCVTEAPVDYLNARRVRIGAFDLSAAAPGVAIEAAVVHKDYDPDRHVNDIALLKVALPSSDEALGIRPAQILGDSPRDKPLRSRQRVTVTGWGSTKVRSAGSPLALARDGTAERASQVLQLVGLEVLPWSRCGAVPDLAKAREDSAVCAGSKIEGRDSCNGDSGGPLMRDSDQRLVGLVSFGIGCGIKGMPALYTRVSAFRVWIERAKHAPPGKVTRM